jgi:hypothetical protein
LDTASHPSMEKGTSPSRFNIYRNNVMVGLRRALEDVFPVVRALVGDEFFAAMAQTYIRAHPPESPVLMKYGFGFDAFIQDFDPARSVPYLADVARLELARLAAFHAADHASLTIHALRDIPDAAIESLRLGAHPSAHLYSTDHPAVSIWQAHQGSGPVSLRDLPHGPQYAMVVRPGLDVAVIPLEYPVYEFGTLVFAGVPLGIALDSVDLANLDPTQVLQNLFATGAVATLHREDKPCGDTG